MSATETLALAPAARYHLREFHSFESAGAAFVYDHPRIAFERNLLYVDQTLVECRHQLNDNPADDVSQELMLNAYREKVRLLEGFDKFKQ